MVVSDGRTSESVGLSLLQLAELMDELGYGQGYKYAHDYEDKITDIQCLPDNLLGTEYYIPGDQGEEVRFRKRLDQIKKWHREHNPDAPSEG